MLKAAAVKVRSAPPCSICVTRSTGYSKIEICGLPCSLQPAPVSDVSASQLTHATTTIGVCIPEKAGEQYQPAQKSDGWGAQPLLRLRLRPARGSVGRLQYPIAAQHRRQPPAQLRHQARRGRCAAQHPGLALLVEAVRFEPAQLCPLAPSPVATSEASCVHWWSTNVHNPQGQPRLTG